jgi:hypothetical protein
LSQLIKTALVKCDEHGIKITSITTDGLKTNFTAANKLGCDLYGTSYAEIRSTFPHPVTGQAVGYIPDAVHMLKLARNCLGTYDLESPSGVISFEYIRAVYEVFLFLYFYFH